jgi:hypothetical protein
MRTTACALLGLALTTWLAPGELIAGTPAQRGTARKASGSRPRGLAGPRRGTAPRGQLRAARPSPEADAPDTMSVTVGRDGRGEVEAAARALMRRSPTGEPARRATWKKLLLLADGTGFRDEVVRAAFRLTRRSDHSEFGMHFANAPRGRGLPRDVHKAIYGYKPLPGPVNRAIEVVTWPLSMALLVLAGDQ